MKSKVTSESKGDVYATITEKIVSEIVAGADTFTMPWHGAGASALPVNAATKARYRGINILALWIGATTKGCASGYWASYRQWQSLGAQVRKGERGTGIVFYKDLKNEAREEGGEEPGKQRNYFARASYVFNASQVDGWEEPLPPVTPEIETRGEIDAFVAATSAEVRHGGALAQYRIDKDCIEMPDRLCFIGSATSTATESYYAVLLHELTHWSGAAHRLDRQFGKRFGDKAYAFEELVAELGAAFLCANLRVTNEPRLDHAAYVASWLTVLANDRKAIFTAASRAQQAAEYLTGLAASNLLY